MGKQLMIIEVSQKQAYIFSSRDLEENRKRSLEIVRVTSEAYFQQVCPEGYTSTKNMVYTGGGHAVLQFPDKPSADDFARALTLQVRRDYPKMELFVRQLPYQSDLSPRENLLALSKALEEKKALRSTSFYMKELGVEAAPSAAHTTAFNRASIAESSRTLAIVHIDGNAMGARVAKAYEKSGADWDLCISNLQQFSTGIEQDFSASYCAMEKNLYAHWDPTKTTKPFLYKIIAAGDDLCFIVSAECALECAASFLKNLSKRKNVVDGEYYSACAGIAVIDDSATFRQGYDLSEALCANAKHFAAAYGADVSALDFQIISGVPKDSLQEIREGYQAEDGSLLLLRPFGVTGTVPKMHSYSYLVSMLRRIQNSQHTFARSALLQNRQAFILGQQEVRYALHMSRAQLSVNRMLHNDENNYDLYFTDSNGKRICLFFDALELAPFTILREGDPHE